MYSLFQDSEAEVKLVPVWVLVFKTFGPVFKAAALGQGHRTQAAGESGRLPEVLGFCSAACGDIKHGWQCCLNISFIQHPIQERITMEKATSAGKVWESQECYQLTLPSVFFCSGQQDKGHRARLPDPVCS